MSERYDAAAATRATVIIPTWNGADLLRSALRSLERQAFRDFETVVVDNGSTDTTAELLAREFPQVRMIRFAANRGFAAAVNAGIAASAAEYVVLMNNDVEADAHWLGALVGALDAQPDVGSCASRMLSWSAPSRIDSAGDMLDWFAYSIGHGEEDGPEFNDPRFVLSACAGAAIYRRAALDQVGLFDERFFAYLEDVDLGLRLQLAGWQCLYVPEAVALHRGSATASRIPAFKLQLLLRNSLYIFLQYMPARELMLRSPLMLVWPFYRAVRERQPVSVGWRTLASVWRERQEVLDRRRRTRAMSRISASEFRSLLGRPPVTKGAV